jgi:hypothetical protein
VGKSTRGIGVREREHLKNALDGSTGCPYFYHAVRKYGVDAFLICTLAIVSDYEELNHTEINLIKGYLSEDSKFGYNLTPGGDGLSNPSVEIRAKMSAARKGKKQSPETVAKRVKCLYGNTFSLGRKQSDAERRMRSERSGMKGTSVSSEVKQKLHLANLGRGGRLSALGKKWVFNPNSKVQKLVFPSEVDNLLSVGWLRGMDPEVVARIPVNHNSPSPETLAKRSKSLTGKKRTPETIQRMSEAAKKRGVSREHILYMIESRLHKTQEAA